LGVASVPVAYGLGTALFGRRAGLWGALLLTVDYAHVRYSQEVRMYALLVLGFAGALWGLVVGATQQRARGWVVYAVSGSLLVYAQGLGPVYVAVIAALFPLLAPRAARWRTWRPWLIANGVIALVFLPWLTTAVEKTVIVTTASSRPPSSPEPPLFTTLHYLTVE